MSELKPCPWKIGQVVIYKGAAHEITDVDEGYGYLALGGDYYITPNDSRNRCISAPMDECYLCPAESALQQEVERLRGLNRIAELIGTIFFAGDFVAETINERELESLLINNGYRYRSWDEIEALAHEGGEGDA